MLLRSKAASQVTSADLSAGLHLALQSKRMTTAKLLIELGAIFLSADDIQLFHDCVTKADRQLAMAPLRNTAVVAKVASNGPASISRLLRKKLFPS